MTDLFEPSPLILDQTVEQDVRDLLTRHFGSSYLERTENYVTTLLETSHYASRFQYLFSVIDRAELPAGPSILVSGCGSGSEMLAARQFGFANVWGVEVERIWVAACRKRLNGMTGMATAYYDGNHLPLASNSFHVVGSGHVIEHTADPDLYLQECMRVLAPGGYLSLEFPSRYHHRELHTQLPSFEWLPTPVRNAAIRLASSRWSPLNAQSKSRYRSIVDTNLKQISTRGVIRMLKGAGIRFTMRDITEPVPGIVRCVIRKEFEG